jgi:hypothetical protein
MFSNLPLPNVQENLDSAAATVRYFDRYFNSPIELDNQSAEAIKAYFEKRGFLPASAESIALIILTQAKKDNLNAAIIMDSLSGLSDVELSGLVSEILNYNRFKTSTLGIYIAPTSSDEIQRNILP